MNGGGCGGNREEGRASFQGSNVEGGEKETGASSGLWEGRPAGLEGEITRVISHKSEIKDDLKTSNVSGKVQGSATL